MKAITTGFAVTALAAAISGQAMAAEATYEFSGQINVESVFDLEAETRTNAIVDDTDGDQDKFELTVVTSVTNGPFSGSLVIEDKDNDGDDAYTNGYASGAVDIYLDDLMVEEGKISFGQLSDVFTTDSLMETAADDDDAVDFSYGVTGGLRYTDADLGLKVQAEGLAPSDANNNDAIDVAEIAAANPFGVSVAFAQDIGMGTVYAEAQYAEAYDLVNGGMEARDTFIGLGAELNPTEELAVVAAFHSAGTSVDDSAYAVRADYTMDMMSAYGSYYEPSSDTTDDEVIMVGGSYTMDMLTFSADYTMTTADSAGDEVAVGVAYANDNIEAYADLTLGNFDADTADSALIEVGASMTSEAGVVYAADYTMQAEEAAALTPIAATSEIALSAKYSF